MWGHPTQFMKVESPYYLLQIFRYLKEDLLFCIGCCVFFFERGKSKILIRCKIMSLNNTKTSKIWTFHSKNMHFCVRIDRILIGRDKQLIFQFSTQDGCVRARQQCFYNSKVYQKIFMQMFCLLIFPKFVFFSSSWNLKFFFKKRIVGGEPKIWKNQIQKYI